MTTKCKMVEEPLNEKRKQLYEKRYSGKFFKWQTSINRRIDTFIMKMTNKI